MGIPIPHPAIKMLFRFLGGKGGLLPRVRPMKHVNECRSWDSRIFTPLDAEFWVFLSRRRQRLRHCLCSFALQLSPTRRRRWAPRKWDTKFRTKIWVLFLRRRKRLRHCSFALQQTLQTDLVRRFPQRGDAVEHQQKWDTKFRISGRKVSLKFTIGKCMFKDDGRAKSKSK